MLLGDVAARGAGGVAGPAAVQLGQIGQGRREVDQHRDAAGLEQLGMEGLVGVVPRLRQLAALALAVRGPLQRVVGGDELGFPGQVPALDRQSDPELLRDAAQLVDVLDLGQRERGHEEAAVRLEDHQAVPHQTRQRLADDRTAGLVVLSERHQLELVSGGPAAGQNVIPERVPDLGAEGLRLDTFRHVHYCTRQQNNVFFIDLCNIVLDLKSPRRDSSHVRAGETSEPHSGRAIEAPVRSRHHQGEPP